MRGLSRNQICIGVATDKKHTICFVEGLGKPSQKRSYDTFKDYIAFGAPLIHDNEKTHKKLVEKLNLKSVSYSSSYPKGLADSESPLDPVNRIHCLLKVFLNAHSGFCRDEIQDYLYCSLLQNILWTFCGLRSSPKLLKRLCSGQYDVALATLCASPPSLTADFKMAFRHFEIARSINLYSFVINSLSDHLEKFEKIINLVFENPKSLKYRDQFGSNS